MAANTGGLPGWTVTQGDIDFGNYKTEKACRKACAHGGQAMLDICGSNHGAIAQTVTTVPNVVYVLTLAYDAHANCGKNTVSEMDVVLDGKTVARLQHKNEATWDLDWGHYRYDSEDSNPNQ